MSIDNAFVQMVHGNYFPMPSKKGYLLFKHSEGHVKQLNFGVYDILLNAVIEEDCGAPAF